MTAKLPRVHYTKECECGCGGILEVDSDKNRKHLHNPPRFLTGHQRKGSKLAPIKKTVQCQCGCGGLIEVDTEKFRHHHYKTLKFIPGHQGKGKPRNRYIPTLEEIPSGICECGCGEKTEIVTVTYKDRRWFIGYPKPYLPNHKRYRGEKSHKWKGGRWKHKSGYIYVYVPNHPYCNRDRYVLEHRIIMEKYLGRFLIPTEEVHHINEIIDDNIIENLLILTKSQHKKLHELKKLLDPPPPIDELLRLLNIERVPSI